MDNLVKEMGLWYSVGSYAVVLQEHCHSKILMYGQLVWTGIYR